MDIPIRLMRRRFGRMATAAVAGICLSGISVPPRVAADGWFEGAVSSVTGAVQGFVNWFDLLGGGSQGAAPPGGSGSAGSAAAATGGQDAGFENYYDDSPGLSTGGDRWYEEGNPGGAEGPDSTAGGEQGSDSSGSDGESAAGASVGDAGRELAMAPPASSDEAESASAANPRWGGARGILADGYVPPVRGVPAEKSRGYRTRKGPMISGDGTGSAADSPVATTALDWMRHPRVNEDTGDANWDDWCLGFVNQVFLAANGRRDPNLLPGTARGSYQSMVSAGRISQDFENMPSGAAVYWNVGRDGHVAVFSGTYTDSGDPLIITTTGWGGMSGIQEIPLSDMNRLLGRPAAGYAGL